MTIREYLKARVMRIYRVGLPFVALILLSAIYGRNSAFLSGLTVIAIATYLVVYIVLLLRTPCVRCSAPLGNTALHWGSKRLPTPRCPHCGVSIDEQINDSSRL